MSFLLENQAAIEKISIFTEVSEMSIKDSILRLFSVPENHFNIRYNQ